MKRCIVSCLLIILFIVGCGETGIESPSKFAAEQPLTVTNGDASKSLSVDVNPTRKIIYATDVALIVESLTSFDHQLNTLVAEYDGYISRVNFNNLQRKNKTGIWTVRVPVSHHEKFIVSAEKFGNVTSKHQKAEDVSDEFVDLESRIKNKQLLEDRIAKLIDSYQKSLPEMIKVEYELSRVREEIERMQGRLNYLKNKTGLATITFNAQEKEGPIVVAAAAPFKTQVSIAWGTAVDEITGWLQNVVIFFARYSLIILTIIVGFGLAWLAIRPFAARISQTNP